MSTPSQFITLLQINDTHGYLEPHVEHFWNGDHAEYRTAGGYARIKTIFDRIRAEQGGAVIALDNGDTFHGTYVAVETEGKALVAPVNALGLDAWTAHWDFAYGVPALRELAARLSHPLLAINCYDKETGERPDLIVMLSHLGFPQDVKFASETGGIDVLLSGSVPEPMAQHHVRKLVRCAGEMAK